MYISFENIIFQNISGWDNLFYVINSNVSLSNCSWMNISTYSASILYIIQSNFSMIYSNIVYFYPNFLFGSFSQINLQNNVFNKSIDSKGSFKAGAIFFMYNISFLIYGNSFSYLKNLAFGSVKSK